MNAKSLLSQAVSRAKPMLASVSGGSWRSSLKEGLGSMRGPSLLASAMGAGTIGAVMGDQDFSSFGVGMGFGLIGGAMARGAAPRLLGKGLRRGGEMTMRNPKFSHSSLGSIPKGRQIRQQQMMTTNNNARRTLFAGGALLSGGFFSSMFAGNGTSYKQGFNANRGNSIVR